ncbi:thiol reductant ABC exporter subunit CydD [Kutzneria sp. NPDC052558]|uniref:thiol reductant ABC exporter subunit CydD n=1 Tax=Kutzneria sp. NPDC052558 TaxID=3364121 RepID=UPI0037CBA70C
MSELASESVGAGRRGPLGDLPALSPSTRRALVACGLLSVLNAMAVVAQAWALAAVLASVVTGHGDRPFALLAGAVLVRSVVVWAVDTMSARAAAGAKEELRARALDRALSHGPEWIATHGPAELTVLATKGLDALDAYFTRYLPALVTAAVAPLLVGLAILVADVQSAVLIAVTVPLIPVFAILIGRYTEQRTARSADATARLSGHLLELVRALPVLAAFGRAQAQTEAVRRVGEQHRKATGSTLRVAFLSAFALETVATLSVALVAVDIGLRLVGGTLGLATGLLVLILTPECYLPLRAAGAAFHASEDGLEAVRRVAEIGQAEPGGAAVADGEIKVDRLSVRRRGGLAPDGASFTVRRGHITRLDSPSGAGKSTTVAVLLGFVRPTRGLVTVGGVDLSTVDLSTWRRQVAWAPQRPAFSAEIVVDELALVGGDLAGVAAKVGAEHLLERPIVELSTGERQRVAIARALLRVEQGARWLLLDEPTAHLDPATAGLVMAAIAEAADRGAGVLLATHRVAAPEDAAVVAGVATSAVKADLVASKARLTELLNRRSMIGVLLGVLAVGSGIALTATAAWLIARASQQPPEAALAVAVVAVRAFGLGKGALRYLERLVTHDAAFRLGGGLRVRLWEALVRIGPARTTTLRRTDGVQRLVDDTDAVRDLVPRVLVPPLVGLLVAIGAVVLEAAVLPAAGAVLAVALLVAGIGGPAVALLVERRATTALAAGRRDVAAKVLTLFDAAPDLIAFGAVRRRRSELAAADAELAATARRQALGAGAANALVTASIGVATLICSWLAASAAGLDPVLVPLLALVPLATTEAVAAIPPAAQQWGALRSAHQRVTELTGTCGEEGSTRRESPSPRDTADLARRLNGERDVRLAGVDVRWPGADRAALRGIDLDVPAGSHVAVVGPSGAGKSTLMALLLGFLAPERGTAVAPSVVSWCPQEPMLVSTTVRENLRLGDPEASDERLREALRDAQLAAWTDRLDVVVGTGGAAVSGGEAQRLAMARALLRADQAGLVLLDEPTAHLDEPTARALLARLRTRLAGRTVVHVTHRLDEAAEADLVIEVNDGTIRPRRREAV